jgi:hypothetical protein
MTIVAEMPKAAEVATTVMIMRPQPVYPIWTDTPFWQGFYLYERGWLLAELPSLAMAAGWRAALEAEAQADVDSAQDSRAAAGYPRL